MKKEFIRLAEAYLCVNCDAITSNYAICPACSGRSLLSLANVLNRKGVDNRVAHLNEMLDEVLVA